MVLSRFFTDSGEIIMDFKSIFTGAKAEACEATASKLFDVKTPMMVKQMERAGDDAETIKAAVVERKADYIKQTCGKPKM
jgi:hypothetical protein